MCNSRVIHSNTLYTNFNEEIILIYFLNLSTLVGKVWWSTFCGWVGILVFPFSSIYVAYEARFLQEFTRAVTAAIFCLIKVPNVSCLVSLSSFNAF